MLAQIQVLHVSLARRRPWYCQRMDLNSAKDREHFAKFSRWVGVLDHRDELPGHTCRLSYLDLCQVKLVASALDRSSHVFWRSHESSVFSHVTHTTADVSVH